jgi:DNA-binding NarL/FixJ family response regulator
MRAILSASELEILGDAARGCTVSESAARRSKGAQTVKAQRASILRKLDARNMAQAVGMAAPHGLIGHVADDDGAPARSRASRDDPPALA